MRPLLPQLCAAAAALALFTGCSTIASYDQVAYAQATSLKVDTLQLVGQATEAYAGHAAEISALNTSLAKAYEYDRGRLLNQKTVELWDQLLFTSPADPDRGILPRFFALWKDQGTVSHAYLHGRSGRPGERDRIGRAFDKVIALESSKNR